MSMTDQYDRSYAFGRIIGAKGGPPVRIAVAVDPGVASDPTAQLIAAAICNLLPRITERYTNVDLLGPADQRTTIPRTPPGLLLPHLLATLGTACLSGN